MRYLQTSPFSWRHLVALLVACLVCTALWAEAAQTQLADHVIRLHVLANSDTQADQDLKLQVRDAVLARTDAILADQDSADQAAALLQQHLEDLAQTAEAEIQAQGYDYPVEVRLEETWFPTRTYENVSLPAGNYLALRVLIGQAEGHNWWCVVFPSLCLTAVTETSLQAAGLTHDDYQLISEEDQPYQIRFKTVELWQTCKHWFAQLG